MTVTTTDYFPRVHRVPGRTHARLRPRSAPLVAQATKRARDFSAAPFAGKKVSAPRRGGLFATDRTHIACDVCTTGKWYPRTAARVASTTRSRSRARERRTEVETPRQIGKGTRLPACLPAYLLTCLPTTEFAAGDTAGRLWLRSAAFRRVSPFLPERCLSLISVPLYPRSLPQRRSAGELDRATELQPFLLAPSGRGGR